MFNQNFCNFWKTIIKSITKKVASTLKNQQNQQQERRGKNEFFSLMFLQKNSNKQNKKIKNIKNKKQHTHHHHHHHQHHTIKNQILKKKKKNQNPSSIRKCCSMFNQYFHSFFKILLNSNDKRTLKEYKTTNYSPQRKENKIDKRLTTPLPQKKIKKFKNYLKKKNLLINISSMFNKDFHAFFIFIFNSMPKRGPSPRILI